MRKTLLFLLFLFSIESIIAQPINDDCGGIIDLGVAPICPHPDTFNNVNATTSIISSDPTMNTPSCFNNSNSGRDVWFQFTTPTNILDFNVTITGVNGGPNGSISQPQVAVYRGNCVTDQLGELACASASLGMNELSFDLNGLDPNVTYFLRVSEWSTSATPNAGDFVLCIKEPDFIMGTDFSATRCEGTVFDSGGPNGEYSNDENNTFTICPDVPTGCIDLDFVSFDIENTYDFLTIYDGPNTSAPEIISFTGTQTFPIQVGNDCVTLQFTSDFSFTEPGFEIAWTCSPVPCQTTLIPCQVSTTINQLPFSANGETTCGAGDDVSNGPCSNDDLLDGEDVVYIYQTFEDICLDFSLTNIDPNTSLSIYNDCPETASECINFAQNTTGDAIGISNLELQAFETIYIVISNGTACTEFDLLIEGKECPVPAAARSSCEDALILNVCEELPELFLIAQQANLNPDFYQTGVNDGCWPGLGARHYSWLFFQAQANGEFGFLAQNASLLEASNINIQVWGPVANYEDLCGFMANNQPVRSTGAANATSILTGLVNVNPLDNSMILDDCEDTNGDGFITTLPVQAELFYLILINDFDGNIADGAMSLDFSPTTPGVLDGLPEDTDLIGQEHTLIGDAAYYTENFDFSCIQITRDEQTQRGCAWAENKVDFSQPFSNTVAIYLGENDGGADGICMVYHNSVQGNTICGVEGQGIGAQDIDNSFIIEFDTWDNNFPSELIQDHIAVNVNGDMEAPIAGPISLGNIEDGLEHAVTFNWDPATNDYEVLFDGTVVISGNYDIIQNSFQGEPVVYCGYTGSTGAATNLQYVCTGDNLYPTNTVDTVMMQICEGESIFVGGAEQTEAGFYSDIYTAFNNCDSTIVTELMVLPQFTTSETSVICEGDSEFLEGAEQTEPGIYTDILTAINGCDSIIETTLTVLPNSETMVDVVICEGESIFLAGSDQTVSGTYTDVFMAENSCDSTVITMLEVIAVEATIAPPSPISCEEECTVLDASGSTEGANVSYTWTVSGEGSIDSNAMSLNPTICGEGNYTLTVAIDGSACTDMATVEVALNTDEACDDYQFPNIFTPNGDGTSDLFAAYLVGDRYSVQSLKIYNRWGQKVHEGSGTNHAWDGTVDGKNAPTDVYIFTFELLDADEDDKVIIVTKDVTLVR